MLRLWRKGMKITENIKSPAVVLLLTMLAFLTYSCDNGNEPSGARVYEGERVPLSINMGTRNATDNDEAIISVRAIVFNDKDELVYNDVTKVIESDGNAYLAKIRAARGYNNIYIICNETEELTGKLKAIERESDIENVTFSAIGITGPPPMYGNVAGAYVESRSDGKNATVTIDGVKKTELPVEVTRMVSRISFTAIKNITNPDEDFTVTNLTVKVCRMPVETPIGKGRVYEGGNWSDELTISGSGTLDTNGTYTINGNEYSIPAGVDVITTPATYIPEHLLADPKNALFATYLKIDAQCVLKNGSSQVLNSIYLLNIGQEPPVNHNLTRNHHYQIYATITGMGAMGIYAEIIAMEEHDITINWKPIDGLVIVSDKVSDYDPATGASKNVNIWNDYTVYSGILKAYHVETGYKDVLFKYGSLVAIQSKTEGTDFAPPADAGTLNDVLWRPGSYDPLTIKDWGDVPYLSSDGIPADNTPEQVASGLGDPCKLAGLSEVQIRDMGIVDNGQWHMATPEEYEHIMKATNNEVNSYGYLSYHYLLLPHNRYRDETGVSKGDNKSGWYWGKDASVFQISGDPVSAELQNGKNRQSGYMVRCVRNEIPESYMKGGGFSSPSYQGTENNGNAFFSVISNIPYWTATLITEGTGVGSATAFDDFSFEPGGTAVHTTHGSNTQNIRVYVKRRESTQSRSFGIRVKGFGLDGKERSVLFSITQLGYNLRATTELSQLGKLPQEKNTYNLTIQLTPDDIEIPAGKLYMVVYYSGQQKGISNKVATEKNRYSYPITITIDENNSPSDIGLDVHINLNESSGLTYEVSGLSIIQKGTR